LKAKLATKIAQLIERKDWTQAQTAERTALDQPKVSRLLRGQLSGLSADRLFAVLNRLGHSVEVRISAKERTPEKSHTRVMIDQTDFDSRITKLRILAPFVNLHTHRNAFYTLWIPLLCASALMGP